MRNPRAAGVGADGPDERRPVGELGPDARLFDPDGRPITQAQWMRLFADPATRWALHTPLEDGRVLTTVWFGVADRHAPDAPLFETTVRTASASDEIGRSHQFLEGYRTRGEAESGHARWVSAARAGDLPVPAQGDATPSAATEPRRPEAQP